MLTLQSPITTLGLSGAFRTRLVEICNLIGINPNQWWNTPRGIRSLGHVIEYFIVGLVAGFTIKNKIFAVLFCGVISFFDQVLKIFVPMRYFDVGDIPFDVIGFVSGLLIAWIITFTVKKIKKSD